MRRLRDSASLLTVSQRSQALTSASEARSMVKRAPMRLFSIASSFIPAPFGSMIATACRGFLSCASRCLALEGAGGAWLHVVSPAAQFAQDARVLNAALEDLERPFESIGLVEQNFDHAASDSSAVATEHEKGPLTIGQAPEARNLSTRVARV